MTENKKLVIFGLTAIILLYFIVDNHFYKKALENPLQSGASNQAVIVKKGMNVKKIGDLLEEKEIIGSTATFQRYINDLNDENKLQQGRFMLNAGMTIPEITNILIDPKKAQTILTVPEGYSIKQIDKKLVELGLIKENDFIQTAKNFGRPLEGYLFPDTYFLNAGDFSPKNLIEKMLKNFENKTKNFFTGKNVQEIITVASLLEKEVKTSKDLPIVSGIIWKRLKSGWFLNIDATHLYDDSDTFNTYKIKGLPPGPIGNPGIETIKAALNPKNSPYWYYLTKPENGEVVYAKTNDEQNRNRSQYLSH